MTELIWSGRARRDLEAIETFWNDTRPDYWPALFAAAREAGRRVAASPGIGSPVGGSGARKCRIAHTPYLLLYRVSSGRVRILRVRHDRENWLDDAVLA